MTALPTPETLRSRAAVALACADSATDAGRHSTDAARILTETQRAAALAAYARELLTIADAQTPALVTAPAEVSPPDDHEPARGDVYEYAGAHVVVCGDLGGLVHLTSAAPGRPTLGGLADRGDRFLPADFVRRFCRRVSPPREGDEHPRVGDLYRHVSTGDEWVVCALDADAVYLAGARPCLGLVKPLTMSRERFAAEMERAS